MSAAEVANATCNKYGGALPVVKNQKVHEFLVESLKGAPGSLFWIGLRRSITDGAKFRWSDGSGLVNQSANVNWYPVESDYTADTEKHCVGIGTWDTGYNNHPESTFGRWLNFGCKQQHHFICEIREFSTYCYTKNSMPRSDICKSKKFVNLKIKGKRADSKQTVMPLLTCRFESFFF